MTINEVKKYMKNTVSAYYGKGHVFYVMAKSPKPPIPYITLKFYRYKKSRSKITVFDDKEQCYKDYWPAVMMLDINLYTIGQNISAEGKVPVYEDTSESDLADFLMYLASEHMEDDFAKNNVAAEQEGEVKNLSALVNESSAFNYRSMVTVKINFTECSYGKFGQNGRNLPNASEGGSEDLIEDSDYIETITIEGGLK